MTTRAIATTVLALAACSAPASTATRHAEIEHPGCMLVMDLATDAVQTYGAQDCGVPTSPASTFKIPHALVALQTSVVTDPDALVPWDGTPMHFDAWERDHSLRSAIYDSVVWFFRRTAAEIGRERMVEALRAYDYGNADVSGDIRGFWLDDGSLQTTGHDQLEFLARLYRDALPADARHMASVRQMLERTPGSLAGRIVSGHPLPDATPGVEFAAKTGTAGLGSGRVTWLVGRVGCDGSSAPGHVFVSRVLDDQPPAVESPAATYGLEALAALGLLRCTGTAA